MTFKPLSAWVLEARKPLVERRVPLKENTTSREAIVSTALLAWGSERCVEHPSLMNVAGLGLTMMDRLVLHRWSRDAVDMVHLTDLHSLPERPPRLLLHSALLETPHPERGQALFGSTVCLGAYRLSDDDSTWWLVGLTWPDGVVVARWTPVWAGEDLEAGVAHDTSPLISDVEGHRQWGLEAARFVVVAGLLLDAAGSPLASEVPRQSNAARRRAARSPSPTAETWAERRIVLAPTPCARPSNSGSQAGLQDLSGKRPIDADVRGHLKRQPHGPRGEQRRWIWVEGYQARRWVAGKPLRISVQVH